MQGTFSRAKSLALFASCVSMKHFSCEVFYIDEPPETVGDENVSDRERKRALVPLTAAKGNIRRWKHFHTATVLHGVSSTMAEVLA